jgi:RHS repeat-associated protein
MATDRLYTGQRWEAGIGLYDYNARYYDPALGRFVQADTVVPSPQNSQSLNRYLYTLGNPLKYVDPSGHSPKEYLVDGGNSTYDYMVWYLRRAWATQDWHEYYTFEEFSTAYWNGLAAAGGDAYDNMTISDAMAFQLTGTSRRTWYWAGVKTNASIMLDPDRWKATCASADVQRVMQFELVAQSMSPGVLSNGPNWTYEGEKYQFNWNSELNTVAKTGKQYQGDFPPYASSQYLYKVDNKGDIRAFARYDSNGRALYRVDLNPSRSHEHLPGPHWHIAKWNIIPGTNDYRFNGWGEYRGRDAFPYPVGK